MGARSGELARRAAMGMGVARNGGEVARELQTIRYSVLDRQKHAERVDQLLAKRKDQGHLMWALRHEAARMEGSRSEIVERLEKLGRPKRIEVTDHAVVRFLERAMGIDINAIRGQIARLIPVERVEADRVLYVRNGLSFLLSKEGAIITILDDYMEVGVEKAFSIDDAGIAPLAEINAQEAAASSAARTLSRRRAQHRAKFEETTARLRAELGNAA